MKITTAFENNQEIPAIYTCLGKNISLPLHFENLPETTKSLVLIFEDADAEPVWTHWLLFNIPPEAVQTEAGKIPAGATEGLANNHSFGYEGPCPKYFKGIHHYYLKVFALNATLNLPAASEREAVEKAMEGCIVDSVVHVGICSSK